MADFMTLTLTIAGISIIFKEVGRDFHARLCKAFSLFISDGCKPEMEMTLGTATPPAPVELFSGRGITLCVNPVVPSGTLGIPENARLFNAALRVLYSWLLPRHNGLLIHASAAEDQGKGYLFCGLSGAGKTTVSKLALESGKRVLTDEIAAIRFFSGRPHVFGTPFWGECPATPMNSGVPLHGLYELRKAGQVRLSGLPSSDTTAFMLRSIVNFDSSIPASQRLLDLAHRTADAAPGSALEFSLKDDYWPAILEGYPRA